MLDPSGDFNQEKRLRKKLRRQLQQDRDNEWTQYSGKMKICSPALNTADGVAVGEATLPTWWNHFKTLLNRQAPSVPELDPEARSYADTCG
ncbi:hypothetical protein RB195_022324 [Necator americanus]|uniref:Uncharacterized protein n=1 Tax=Necator americanus TaxID=51031 RepID=A0ABR1EF48_NECAM